MFQIRLFTASTRNRRHFTSRACHYACTRILDRAISRLRGGFMAEQTATVSAHGFNGVLGIELVRIDAREVIAQVRIGPQHHQPWGIVHGGVYCGIVETVCSMGAQAALTAGAGFIVGTDNHTSFLKATRSGTLRAVARPLAVGKRTQLWEANIENEQGELVATGRVRLMVVTAGKLLAGEPAASKVGQDVEQNDA
jgi:uncharacterized protein (TIGR00369 family)